MYLYLSRKYGLSLDRTGFRLPGDEIPESETGNPFASMDIDGAEQPLVNRETVKDFYRLDDGKDTEPQITCIRLSEEQLMNFCREFDGSPNAFLAVMFARAARHFDPDSEKTVSISVAVNHKAILGNFDNYRMGVNVAELDFKKSRSLDDLMKACTIARGQLFVQTQPENSLWTLKQRKAVYAKMDQVPLEMKLDLMAKSAGSPRWSFSVSYISERTLGLLDPYIEELYALSEPGVSDIVCEITCINGSFFLAVCQRGTYDSFMKVFLDELTSIGMDYEVMRKEPIHLCGTEAIGELIGLQK